MTLLRHVRRLTFLLLGMIALPLCLTASPQSYDLIIRGGIVVDGTGSPPQPSALGIRKDRVAAVGDLSGASANRVLNVQNLHIAPGFIDTHSHATPGLLRNELRTAHALLAQGITTIFANPDGGGPVNLATQRDQLENPGIGVNVAPFIPHGSVRRAVLGMQAREATPEELERMRGLVRAGMSEGAFGLSSGLYYAPGSYAPIGEVVELAKVVGEFGGSYQSHIRDESDYSIGVVAAVDEVIQIARAAGIPGVVTHIKALGPRVWGDSEVIVDRISAARNEGVAVYADQYPYEASGTGIVGALIPRWALAGGDEAFEARLQNPRERAQLVEDIWENFDRRGGAERLVLQGGEYQGKSLAEVAATRGTDAVEASLQLLKEGGPTSLVSFNMDDADIQRFMIQPWMMTSSDGGLWVQGEGQPHPRGFGAFARRIGKFLIEDSIGTLEGTIRSMSGLPADVYEVDGRGTIEEGAYADIVVFDLKRFRDLATYDDPHKFSEGIEYALVNGSLAIDEGEFTDILAGTVLKKAR